MVTPLADRAVDPEIARPAVEAAMKGACPGLAVAGAKCHTTTDPTVFACEYELIDNTQDEQRQTTIRRESDRGAAQKAPNRMSGKPEIDKAG